MSRAANGTGRPPLLAVVGPTASGKTEASISLAARLGAEIVGVDSMLVYRGMDVGTAKPSPEDRSLVRHHLIDVVDPDEPFSVARFQRLAAAAIAGIRDRGRRPLLVSGGGLYYRAVVDGLSFPGNGAEVRRLLQAEAATIGAGGLHERLAGLDPAAASKIEPSNVRRTVRALEVAAISGRSFSSFAGDWDRYPIGVVTAAGVDFPREILRRRIEARASDLMPGLVRETEELMARGFERFLTSTQAIGYAESVACLRGELSVEEAAARTARRTKALARRQLAWLRRDPRIRWFPVGEEGAPGIVEELARYLGRARGAATLRVET